MNEHLSIKTLELLTSRQSYHYSHIPYYKEGNCGVYLIRFPNGKRYIGSSNHVFKRIRYHLLALESQYCGDTQWYEKAAKENNLNNKLLPPEDPRDRCDKAGRRMGRRIKKEEVDEYYRQYEEYKKKKKENREQNIEKLLINVFYCDDYREFESAILKSIPKEERQFWYNSKFF